MEWSIQQIARLSGTTSRTLRHYHDIGLVPPTRIGSNGYRYYDGAALIRLQRVLLLRELGLTLSDISQVLTNQQDEVAALSTHLQLLRSEQARIEKQIIAVQRTITALREKESIVAEEIFDGFDHTQYREEVEGRWGAEAYSKSNRWWTTMSREERADWGENSNKLHRDWRRAAEDPSVSPDSPGAQSLAHRHVEWLRGIPGTPAANPEGDLPGYVAGLAEMYVADERFAANYGGVEGAKFVRDALHVYLEGLARSSGD